MVRYVAQIGANSRTGCLLRGQGGRFYGSVSLVSKCTGTDSTAPPMANNGGSTPVSDPLVNSGG